MKIKLVGGQYDGVWLDVDCDEYNQPMSVLAMAPKFKPIATPHPRTAKPVKIENALRYELMFFIRPHYGYLYEYHYRKQEK